MGKKSINIVWIKRDIRTIDHEAFHVAESMGLPYIPIYIFDSELIKYPDTSDRHLQFIFDSIIDINSKLSEFNKEVEMFYGSSFKIFDDLLSQFKIENIYSYQESGIKSTWKRDLKIKSLCADKAVNWTEFQRDGVIRGIKNRKNWNKNWHIFMHSEIINNSFNKQEKIDFKNNFTCLL